MLQARAEEAVQSPTGRHNAIPDPPRLADERDLVPGFSFQSRLAPVQEMARSMDRLTLGVRATT